MSRAFFNLITKAFFCEGRMKFEVDDVSNLVWFRPDVSYTTEKFISVLLISQVVCHEFNALLLLYP